MKYKYRGSIEVQLKGYGIVQAGEIIEAKTEINNPLFQPYIEQEGLLKIKEKKRKRSNN